jgi:hypothetical protein
MRLKNRIRNYDADTITFDIPNVHPLIGDKISVRVRLLLATWGTLMDLIGPFDTQ